MLLASLMKHFLSTIIVWMIILATLTGCKRWWAVTEDQIINANCKKSLPDTEVMKAHLQSASSITSDQMRVVLFGLTLTDSYQLLKAFTSLTTLDDFSTKNSIAPPPIVLSKNCSSVLCAVSEIWGEELGIKLLWLEYKYGFNGSEYAFYNSDRYTVSELDSVIQAVLDYPSSLFPLDRDIQITKFTRGKHLGIHDEDTVAFASISFYDLWSKLSPAMRESTAFHEIAHRLASELVRGDIFSFDNKSFDETEPWLDFDQWIKVEHDWRTDYKGLFVSGYATTNPFEDFAESLLAYRFNPSAISKENYSKYIYIKETIFDGLQYEDEESCQEENGHSQKIINAFKTYKESIPATKESEPLVAISCPKEFTKYIASSNDDKNLLALHNCMKRKGDKEGFKSFLESYLPALTEEFQIIYPTYVKDRLDGLNEDELNKLIAFDEGDLLRSIYYAKEQMLKSLTFETKMNITKKGFNFCESVFSEKYGYMAMNNYGDLYSKKTSLEFFRVKEELYENFKPICDLITYELFASGNISLQTNSRGGYYYDPKIEQVINSALLTVAPFSLLQDYFP